MQRREDQIKKLTTDFDNGHLTIHSFISSVAHLVVNLIYILLDEVGLDQMGLDKVGMHRDHGFQNTRILNVIHTESSLVLMGWLARLLCICFSCISMSVSFVCK